MLLKSGDEKVEVNVVGEGDEVVIVLAGKPLAGYINVIANPKTVSQLMLVYAYAMTLGPVKAIYGPKKFKKYAEEKGVEFVERSDDAGNS